MYCSNCGGRLNGKGFCPNCGGMKEANVKPNQKEDSDVLSCVKAFVTDSPMKGVEKAARTRSAAVWVTFGALFIVSASAMSLAAFGSMAPGFFREVCGSRIASVIANSPSNSERELLSFSELVTHAAVMAILCLVLLTVITQIAFIHAEERPSIHQALNVATFATLPLSLTMLLAIPAALLSIPFAILLIAIGMSASAISYYFGIQKASRFRRSPFLTLFVSAVVAAALLTLCSNGLAMLFFR